MVYFLAQGFLMGSIFFVLALSFIGIYFLFSSGFYTTPPPVPCDKITRAAMAKDLEQTLSGEKNKVIMDLGSGWGGLLIFLARKFPQHSFIGIEKNFCPFHVSRLRARKIANLTFYKEDFFKRDISDADVVLLFLIGHIMPRVTKKCLSEMKKGSFVYTNRFQLTDVKPLRKIFCGNTFRRFCVYRIK